MSDIELTRLPGLSESEATSPAPVYRAKDLKAVLGEHNYDWDYEAKAEGRPHHTLKVPIPPCWDETDDGVPPVSNIYTPSV